MHTDYKTKEYLPPNQLQFARFLQQHLWRLGERVIILRAHTGAIRTSGFDAHQISNRSSVQKAFLDHFRVTRGTGKKVTRLTAMAYNHVRGRGGVVGVHHDGVLRAVP